MKYKKSKCGLASCHEILALMKYYLITLDCKGILINVTWIMIKRTSTSLRYRGLWNKYKKSSLVNIVWTKFNWWSFLSLAGLTIHFSFQIDNITEICSLGISDLLNNRHEKKKKNFYTLSQTDKRIQYPPSYSLQFSIECVPLFPVLSLRIILLFPPINHISSGDSFLWT